MTFKKLCEIGNRARQIARRIGHAFAAAFLKAHNVIVEDAIKILTGKPLYSVTYS